MVLEVTIRKVPSKFELRRCPALTLLDRAPKETFIERVFRERVLQILKAYGVGPNLLRVLTYFWEHAVLVCRSEGGVGDPFRAERGAVQGGPVSPTIFNVMVDAIIREWIRQTLGDNALATGIGEEIRWFMAAFYADDRLL